MRRTVVVLIDDDQDDLDILQESIQAVDNSILCLSFAYPEEAVQAVTSKKLSTPDFVFIDINMPGLSGDKVLQEFRNNSNLDNTVITMLSTSMPLRVSESLKEKGANFTFEKPNKIEDYRSLIASILAD